MACVQGNLSCSSLSHASALECCYSNSSCPQPPFLRTAAGPKAPEEYQLSPVHWVGQSFPQGSLVPHAGVLGFFPVWKSKTRKLRVERGSSSRVERTHKKSDHIFKMKIEERGGIQKDHGERMQGWYLAKAQSLTQWVASVNLMRASCLQLTKDCMQNEKENPKFPSPRFCLLP